MCGALYHPKDGWCPDKPRTSSHRTYNMQQIELSLCAGQIAGPIPISADDKTDKEVQSICPGCHGFGQSGYSSPFPFILSSPKGLVKFPFPNWRVNSKVQPEGREKVEEGEPGTAVALFPITFQVVGFISTINKKLTMKTPIEN